MKRITLDQERAKKLKQLQQKKQGKPSRENIYTRFTVTDTDIPTHDKSKHG